MVEKFLYSKRQERFLQNKKKTFFVVFIQKPILSPKFYLQASSQNEWSISEKNALLITTRKRKTRYTFWPALLCRILFTFAHMSWNICYFFSSFLCFALMSQNNTEFDWSLAYDDCLTMQVKTTLAVQTPNNFFRTVWQKVLYLITHWEVLLNSSMTTYFSEEDCHTLQAFRILSILKMNCQSKFWSPIGKTSKILYEWCSYSNKGCFNRTQK